MLNNEIGRNGIDGFGVMLGGALVEIWGDFRSEVLRLIEETIYYVLGPYSNISSNERSNQ